MHTLRAVKGLCIVFAFAAGPLLAQERSGGELFGGLQPDGLNIADSGNGVLEAGESFTLHTRWQNVSGAPLAFQGRSSAVAAPAGLTLTLTADADYGTVAAGAIGTCIGPCFSGSLTGTRPAGHVDAGFVEDILPAGSGPSEAWILHVGDSFADMPHSSPFYKFAETMLHFGLSNGCGGGNFCPTAATTRGQMAVFLLKASGGPNYLPPPCTTPLFSDVPASSPYCRWVEELVRRGTASGCGNGKFCPDEALQRQQLAVFLLHTVDPTLDPPACTTPRYDDVPASSPFCRWVEEFARRGVTSGCGERLFCPLAPTTREQIAVFTTAPFGLTLYGP